MLTACGIGQEEKLCIMQVAREEIRETRNMDATVRFRLMNEVEFSAGEHNAPHVLNQTYFLLTIITIIDEVREFRKTLTALFWGYQT